MWMILRKLSLVNPCVYPHNQVSLADIGYVCILTKSKLKCVITRNGKYLNVCLLLGMYVGTLIWLTSNIISWRWSRGIVWQLTVKRGGGLGQYKEKGLLWLIHCLYSLVIRNINSVHSIAKFAYNWNQSFFE